MMSRKKANTRAGWKKREEGLAKWLGCARRMPKRRGRDKIIEMGTDIRDGIEFEGGNPVSGITLSVLTA